MKKKIRNCSIKGLMGILLIALLNVAFLGFMMHIFQIPMDETLKTNMGNSLVYFPQNDNLNMPFFGDKSFYFGDNMDMLWTNSATICSGDPFTDAVSMNYIVDPNADEHTKDWMSLVNAIYSPENGKLTQYSRYWNLQVGVLKLLYRHMDLGKIRYLAFLVNCILFVSLLFRVYRKAGVKAALPIVVGSFMTMLLMHSICISFFGDIFNALLGMNLIAWFYDKKWFRNLEYLFYLVIGCFTFAGAPLIAPILTLGMMLLTEVLLVKESDRKLWSFGKIILNSVCWVAGYMETLLVKQILSVKVLGYQTGSDTIVQWIGPELGVEDRLRILGDNFARTFSPAMFKLPLLGILLAGIVFFICKAHKKSEQVLQLLFVSLYPIVWILVIARHSIHWFVSTILCVFIVGILAALMSFIDEEKLSKK